MILTFDVSAEMPGMSGEIRRDYSDTQFGRVHYWTIGEGPALLLVHQSGQTSAEYLSLAPFLADTYKVIGIDDLSGGFSENINRKISINDIWEN